MRYKISHWSSNKREQDRVSFEIAEKCRMEKLQPPSKSSLSYRLKDRRSGAIGRDSQWRVSDAKRTSKGATVFPGWTRMNRSCKSGEDASPRKRGIIKEKLGRSIHVDPPGSCVAAPDDRDKSNFVVSGHWDRLHADENPLQFFPEAIPSVAGNSVIANEDRARCETEREGGRMKGAQSDPWRA